MSKIIKSFLLINLLVTSGCASITTGKMQNVTVSTGEHTGAACVLTNDKGKWYIDSTPDSARINRSYSDLNVTCNKDNYSGVTTVKSNIKNAAYGNVVFGGFIGAAIDTSSGAAFDYQSEIRVDLKHKITNTDNL